MQAIKQSIKASGTLIPCQTITNKKQTILGFDTVTETNIMISNLYTMDCADVENMLASDLTAEVITSTNLICTYY